MTDEELSPDEVIGNCLEIIGRVVRAFRSVADDFDVVSALREQDFSADEINDILAQSDD